MEEEIRSPDRALTSCVTLGKLYVLSELLFFSSVNRNDDQKTCLPRLWFLKCGLGTSSSALLENLVFPLSGFFFNHAMWHAGS